MRILPLIDNRRQLQARTWAAHVAEQRTARDAKALKPAAPTYYQHAAETGRSGSMRETVRMVKARNWLQRAGVRP